MYVARERMSDLRMPMIHGAKGVGVGEAMQCQRTFLHGCRRSCGRIHFKKCSSSPSWRRLSPSGWPEAPESTLYRDLAASDAVIGRNSFGDSFHQDESQEGAISPN